MRYEADFYLDRATEPYEIRDVDNGCGDPDCCGEPYPRYYVWVEGRKGWYGGFYGHGAFKRAEVFVRRLKRWNVK